MSKHNLSGHQNLTIDPFRFMELDKPAILYKLTSELSYSEEEALREFDAMIAMLTRLKSMRCCQSQTDDWLKDAVPNLHPRVKITAVTILLNATEGDDTYCHAYNTFVYYFNRYLRTNRPRKIISDRKLLILLEEEARQLRPVTGVKKLSLQQIALKYAWEGKLITPQNKDEIASFYGYKAGHKLYQNYCQWSRRANRIADPDGTEAQIEHKIKLFKSVIGLLLEKNRAVALEEMKILQSVFETTYLK
jgi:hypothetical protein